MAKGTTVKWKSTSETTHHVDFYKKPSGAGGKPFTLMPSDVKTRTLEKAGVYRYRGIVSGHSTLSEDGKTCIGMCGRVKATSS